MVAAFIRDNGEEPREQRRALAELMPLPPGLDSRVLHHILGRGRVVEHPASQPVAPWDGLFQRKLKRGVPACHTLCTRSEPTSSHPIGDSLTRYPSPSACAAVRKAGTQEGSHVLSLPAQSSALVGIRQRLVPREGNAWP